MRIVAIKDMSAGNESIGEMWQETKIFEPSDTLEAVVKWGMIGISPEYGLRKHVRITVAQE